MRKIFVNRYEQGFDAGSKKGYDDGFMSGSKKAIAVARKVFIKNIKAEIEAKSQGNGAIRNQDYIRGLERAIEIIKKG